MKKFFMHVVSVIFIFIATVNCSAASEKILVGIIGRSTFNWPIYVMFDRSFFANDTQNVKLIIFENEDRALAALASGSIQVLGSVETERVILNQIQGAPIEIVGSVIHKAPYHLIMSHKLDNIQELKGKMIGVPRYNSGSAVLLKSYMKDHRLYYPKDYRMVELGRDDVGYAAVKYEKTSAAIVAAPAAYQADKGGMILVGNWAKIFPEYQFMVIAMNRDWARNYSGEAIKVMRGLLKTLNWIYNTENREEAIRILDLHTKIGTDIAQKTYENFLQEDQIFTKQADVHPHSVNLLIKSMIEAGILKERRYKLSEFINDYYRREALLTCNAETNN